MFAVTPYVLAGHALPLYVTVWLVTVLQPVIVLFGAVYLHAVFAVDPVLPPVLYDPPDGLTPVKLLHNVQAVFVCALLAMNDPSAQAVHEPPLALAYADPALQFDTVHKFVGLLLFQLGLAHAFT